MWCDHPKCKKEVDINSVAVNKPIGALSADIEGDVTPTIIHSTSNIINICKSCGESDYLFDSEASAKKEDERRDSIFRNLESKVRSLLETDGKISAIKSLRDECPYLGLADAKMQVDRLESGQSFLLKGDKLDGLPTDSSSGSGCLIVALTVPVGLLTFKALEHLLF